MASDKEKSLGELEEQKRLVCNIVDMLDLIRHKKNIKFKSKRELNELLDGCVEIFIPREKINVKFIADVEKYFAPETE